jgi:hemerythrin superfamily protein
MANNGQSDAVEMLTEQHREVENLFEQLESAGDADEKEELFQELANKLAIHAKIEEQHFYPAVREKKTEEMVLEAFVEHTSIKRLLADLLETSSDDASFDAKIKVLKEQVEHHVEEEESELFDAAKQVLSEDELMAVGQEMMSLQSELESAGAPSDSIPQELGDVTR